MTRVVSQIDGQFAELNTPLDGRYQVVEILSARLWARTYLAQDLHRPSRSECIIHHLKTIPIVPNYAAVMRGLFAREATIFEHLGTHDQIPQLLAWFEDAQGFYIVQEFVSGQPFSLELQPQSGWSAEKVWQFLHQVLEPLAWVHRHGSIHGNLKPANLLRRVDGQIALIDLSSMSMLQHALMAAHGLFVPPTTGAQQGYQPLEQLQGIPCAASDVYALGMMAVQAMTGTKPTDFEVDPETITICWQAHLQPATSPLHQALIPILDTMVQWNLPCRYANADQVLLALQDVAQLATVPTSPLVKQPLVLRSLAMRATPIAVMDMPAEQIAAPAVGSTPSQTQVLNKSIPMPSDQPSSNQPPGKPPKVGKLNANRQKHSAGVKWWMQTAMTSPSVRISAGGVAVATTFAAVGWGLLNSVDWAEKTNTVWNRMTAGISNGDNLNQKSIKTLSNQWRQDWQQASTRFQQAEAAFKQGEWAKAKQLAATMPNIPYWRDRGAALTQQVTAQAETDASQRLKTAMEFAHDRKFTNARHDLEQIDTSSSVAATAQAKTKEYREKQNTKAWFDLQQAYNRAVARDFVNALAFLYQIPAGTEAYDIAQTKIAEYKQKEKIRVKTLLSTANEYEKQQELTAAVSTLEQISTDAAAHPQVTPQIEAYLQELDQQAEIWLQKAERQVQAGRIAAAIASLENVPIGTPAYTQAREQILELTATLHPAPRSTTSVTVRAHQEVHPLNPGSHVRDAQIIISQANLQVVK
jgi:serine/threonine protein kinase